ncbi:ssDNA-binding domain-containing protein [Ferrovum sp. PN-J185]|uniref:ArdC family protein n=1 Tax=Ferrovum sp. PN-J185 TaxID=1356306 RepID=UPI0007951605|nr:zincin-like metallopeptidase domain-containing protein [Ferrovum sp. PN-J185]KXW56484.1 DNA primase TraC [Ferrovum sp. PN-J185]MCC6068167.1 ssDNA-binding domain-containing protein [Ferrovum sp. PN-J185]
MVTSTKEILNNFIKSLTTLLNENKLPPWQKPWCPQFGTENSKPHNPITGQPYRGFNALHLSLSADIFGFEDPRWMGFHQAQQMGWKIKAGEQGTAILLPVTHVKKSDVRNDTNEESSHNTIEKVTQFRTAYVFNAQQIIGISCLKYISSDTQIPHHPRILEKIAYQLGIKVIETASDTAYYSPHLDIIKLPLPHQFRNAYARNSTFAHELAHASGNEHRLARNQSGKFGSNAYCIEEITAEIGAYLLCRELGLHYQADHPDQTDEQHLAYTAHWINLLHNDPQYISLAISQGSEAAKFLSQQHQIQTILEEK